MKPDFSEFSYGYAVTEELVATSKALVVAAPVFPSLYEEGKSGGGYDVKIPFSGKPIFLQFKLSDYLKQINSKEHRTGILSVPYYRMFLRPTKHSDQHNLLLELEKSGQSVFYIAPEFHLPVELNDFYLKNAIVANSTAFTPMGIGLLPDDEEHYVVFKRGTTIGYRCSDMPLEIPRIPLKDGLESLVKFSGIQSRRLGYEGLNEIMEQMLEVLTQGENQLQEHKSVDIGGLRRIISNRSIVESIGYIARTFFDAQLLILP